MSYSPAILRTLLSLVLASLVVACSASSRVVRIYDGSSQDESQVARIETPATIKVLSIDGQRQKTYLTDSISMTYELLPGEHTIVYQYASIWSVPRGVQREDFSEDTAKVQNVDSAPISAVINLEPGGRYKITHRDAKNVRDAQTLAANFTADIVSETGEHVAQRSSRMTTEDTTSPASIAMEPGERPAAGAPKAPVPVSVNASAVEGAPALPTTAESEAAPAATSGTDVGEGVSRLEGLKVLWGKASKEDKKEFLRWAFQ
ncbi:DUF2057 family protein [Allohahella marinimesophila]|uniref:DUF2057 domain-containing protein n=1 Tax=Allohahella marinimesophila TaxID=1054972 RepID=A0ABP7PUD2_9GAMM